MDLTNEQNMLAYLRSNHYPSCGRVQRMSEGLGGFVFRAFLGENDQVQSIIAKHVQGYAARATSWKLDQSRLEYEHKALEVLAQPELHVEGIRPPKVLHFDRESWVLIMEDAGDVPSLKGWVQPGVSLAQSKAFGATIGRLLAKFHNFSAGNEVLLESFDGNATAKFLSGTYYFANLPVTAAKYGYHDEFFKKAAEQGQRDVQEASEVLTLGDFWTGNVLVSKSLGLFVLDTELAKPGTADFDVGQMAAEMYCLSAFRDREVGLALLQSFLDTYRNDRDGKIDAAKVAVRIGAHLLAVMPGAWQNEASETQIKEQVEIGVQLIRLGVEGNKDKLRNTVVQHLLP